MSEASPQCRTMLRHKQSRTENLREGGKEPARPSPVCLPGRHVQAGAVFGLVVHWRIYPIIYALPVLLFLPGLQRQNRADGESSDTGSAAAQRNNVAEPLLWRVLNFISWCVSEGPWHSVTPFHAKCRTNKPRYTDHILINERRSLRTGSASCSVSQPAPRFWRWGSAAMPCTGRSSSTRPSCEALVPSPSTHTSLLPDATTRLTACCWCACAT